MSKLSKEEVNAECLGHPVIVWNWESSKHKLILQDIRPEATDHGRVIVSKMYITSHNPNILLPNKSWSYAERISGHDYSEKKFTVSGAINDAMGLPIK